MTESDFSISPALLAAAESISRHLDMVDEQKPKVRITEAQRKKRNGQAKDIPSDMVIALIDGLSRAPRVWPGHPEKFVFYHTTSIGTPKWVNFDEICRHWHYIPPKVIRAKLRRMILKGQIDGCYCGCRGDFELIKEVQDKSKVV